MFPTHNSSGLRQSRYRRRKLRTNQHQTIQSTKLTHPTTVNSSIINRFHDILKDLKRPGTRFLTYTITELEPICQQLALQQMSSTVLVTEYCPFLCTFCQSFIYEPITLYCGHTFCDQCIKHDQSLSTINCPHCPDNIQGQIQSPILQAREQSYCKNRFLTELFEQSETLKTKCEMALLCHKGQIEDSNGNHEKAIEIYSQLIDQDNNNHTALYNRANTYATLKEYDHALADATHVISLRPQWAKGYVCHSKILFEMNHLAAALMSSLKALVIDPEDTITKETMALHLHAVLHSNDDKESLAMMESELEQFNVASLSHDTREEKTTSATNDSPLTICKPTQSSSSCYCSQFDSKNLQIKDFDCSICITLLWFPVTTPCGHVFCRECLIRSVDNTQIQCPICKSSLEDFFPMLIQSYVNKTEIISKIIETYFPTEYNERRLLYEQENVQGAAIPRSVINNTIEPIIFEIPIFVCVLTLPHCICPLHVFEPRYRLMMRRTIETESRSFGMCRYDEETENFADYGTLLFIRGLVYTQDGRSIVDTIGQRRFHVVERGMRDGYNTARVELIRDNPIEQHEFDDLFQFNRVTYNRVHHWFDQLDEDRKALVIQRIQQYPVCDDLTQDSIDGPAWAWVMLNLLPIDELLQYTALASRSFRIRLQMISDAMDFALNQQQQQQQQTTVTTEDQT